MFWGPVTEVEVLKAEVQRWGSKSFASQRESGHSAEFPPGCGSLCPGMGFMVRLCLSLFYPFPWMVFVSVPLMCWSQSASFWISLQRNCSVCDCKLGCLWEEWSSGSFYVTILKQNRCFQFWLEAFVLFPFVVPSELLSQLTHFLILLSSPRETTPCFLLLCLREILLIFTKTCCCPCFLSQYWDSGLTVSANWIFLYLVEKKCESKDHMVVSTWDCWGFTLQLQAWADQIL